MKGRTISYSAEELAWIEARRELPRAELHRRFVDTFDRDDVSRVNLTALCKRRGWLTGRTGRFVAGQDPWNAGKSMPYHPNSAATRFRPGERQGKAKHLWKPVGAERITEDGYLERKVHDGLPMRSRWRAVHLIRWEEAHGPVPDGMALKCLDGDKLNTAPSNWAAIPRAMLPRLNGRFGRDYDSAPAELKPTIMAATKLEHRVRTIRKGRD